MRKEELEELFGINLFGLDLFEPRVSILACEGCIGKMREDMNDERKKLEWVGEGINIINKSFSELDL